MRRILLSPRQAPAYGQDFLLGASTRALKLDPLYLDSGGTFPQIGEDIELVVTHDPNDGRVANCISNIPNNINIVGHFHLRWHYLSHEEKISLRQCFKRMSKVILPSSFMIEELNKIFPDTKFEIVNNRVDEKIYFPSSKEERQRFRVDLGIPSDAKISIYYGRLEESKGLSIIQELLKIHNHENLYTIIQYQKLIPPKILRKYRQISLEIKSKKPKNIIIIEDGDPESDRPIRYCDLCYHPSLCEVAPFTILESLSCGVPIVATNSTPFYSHILKEGISTDHLCTVELPDRLRALERQDLILKKSEATSIAVQFRDIENFILKKDASLHPFDPIIEKYIHRDKMIAEFDFIYSG